MKKIACVGVRLASDEAEYIELFEKRSMLDFDIVLIRPSLISFYTGFEETYQGLKSFDDDVSFTVKEMVAYWQREIKQTTDIGKTVIIFLPTPEDAFIDSGRRSFSGTGRNQKTTRHVEKISNCDMLPLSIKPVASAGRTMKLNPKCNYLSDFWEKFQEYFEYQAILDVPAKNVTLSTKVGDRPVSATFSSTLGGGHLIFVARY